MPETKNSSSPKRLSRSRHDIMIAGVAAGIADYFDLDPALIRIAFILITLLGGSGILAYLVLWLVLPKEGSLNQAPEAQIKANAAEIKSRAEDLVDRAPKTSNRNLWGIFLVLFGLTLLLQNFGLARFLDWGRLWPILLIVAGFLALARNQDR